jgi:Flp pilus assembly pilin Flp
MKIKSIKILKNENGANAAEFAIILPILVVLVFGIFQFGLAYNNYITITHAAREGARKAVVDPTDEPLIKQTIIDRAYPIPLTEADITINFPNGIGIGEPVEVEVIYNINVEIPLVGSWDIPLTSRAIMRIEYYEL